jgi:tetratricopeptide (TPR) repeat protein
VESAPARGDRMLESQAFFTIGVANMYREDDAAATEALQAALAIARDAQALDVAANASTNLGVIWLRSGDFQMAHDALDNALRLYTTLRNNANRLAVLYNIANLEAERGDAAEALRLYKETAALADQLDTKDIGVGAQAGIGLAALRLNDIPGAMVALSAAEQRFAARADWWFQGRELLESLAVRLYAEAGRHAEALARFRLATEQLEGISVYAAAWLVADCAATVAGHDPSVWATVQRLGDHDTVHRFVPLSARFTALRDMAERLPGVRFAAPDVM